VNESDDFSVYIDLWDLVPDGERIVTRSSRLLPVRWRGEPAMLKLALGPEEKWGSGLMAWWDGIGAARVIAHEGDALLLERATGPRSLADMVGQGKDAEASRIICDVVAGLHAPRPSPPPKLVPLANWFGALAIAASREGGLFARSAATARMLLADPREVVPLHGDIHHGNILDFGNRGWLAIDPKRLEGERGFDYANLFCNPDCPAALAPGRLARQADVVAAAARLERKRLLQWVLAWAGLSAAFLVEDGSHAGPALQIAEIAAAELDKI
jgi:streptomycin 6-kinase